MEKTPTYKHNDQVQTEPSKGHVGVSTQTLPSCNQAKLRSNITTYMDITRKLRAKRSEIYEADLRHGKLKDPRALEMAIEAEKLKRSGDKLRLRVCEQLRAFVKEIHDYLDETVEQRVKEKDEKSSSSFSVELADSCTELLHCITITAMKEEIFEKERLMSNVRLYDGRSSAYVINRNRWRVRPRPW